MKPNNNDTKAIGFHLIQPAVLISCGSLPHRTLRAKIVCSSSNGQNAMLFKYLRHETLGFFLWTATDSVWHVHMAELAKGNILSAGFVEFRHGVPKCFGESESLALGSRPEDSALLAEQLDLGQHD